MSPHNQNAVQNPSEIALITGASQGIGRVMALTLAKEGYYLALCARNTEKLAALQQQITQETSQCHCKAYACDVRNGDAVKTVVDQVVADFGRLDVLINNAGIAHPSLLLQELSLHEIDDIINTNLKGAIYAMHAALPLMVQQGGGSIININSTAGKTAYPYWSVYAASKFGLRAITRAVAEEQRSNGIRVMGIYPGAVDTAIWDSSELSPESRMQDMIAPQLVADTVAFMLKQPASSWIPELVLEPLSNTL